MSENYSKGLNNPHSDTSSDQTKYSVGYNRPFTRKSLAGNSGKPLSGNYVGNGAVDLVTMHPEAGSPYPVYKKAGRSRDILHGGTIERASKAGGVRRGDDKTQRIARVVVFPAFLKTIDEHGRKVSDATRLSKPELARWLGG